MEGKLYTAQEVFDALQAGVGSLYDKDDIIKSLAVAKIGVDVAYETMRALKFDEEKVLEYCKKKMEDINETQE